MLPWPWLLERKRIDKSAARSESNLLEVLLLPRWLLVVTADTYSRPHVGGASSRGGQFQASPRGR